MATGMTCDVDQEHGEAQFLVTFLEAAEAKAMCTACFARTGLEIAAAVLPADEVIARVTPTAAPAGANGENGAATSRPRKRAAKTAQRRRPEQAVEGVAETPPPAADQ